MVSSPGGVVMTARDAAAAFEQALGYAPDGVWSAPGRVNLIGEHTDYNDGIVFPFAIDRRAFLAAARNDDGMLRIRSVQKPDDLFEVSVDELHLGAVHHWTSYVAGAIWALREAGHAIGGLDIVLDSTVPVGSGLSSSAALECAALLAAADLYGVPVDRQPFALLAQRAENMYVGMPCGSMDQMASMMGDPGHALFYDVRDGTVVNEPFEPGTAGLVTVVIDTRAHHALADGEYAKRREACEEAARQLGVASLREIGIDGLDAALGRIDADLGRHVRHVVTENERVFAARDALRAGDFATLGKLLDESHQSLAEDYRVSSDELDVAVVASRAAGAIGARMTGGGFGGSAIALIAADRVGALTQSVEAAFNARGFGTPGIWVVEPSDGAHRDQI